MRRCAWCASTPDYRDYHDREWGFPVADDRRLFEKLCLEGFQAGLSWLTILRKRENFRAAFAGFDFERVARFGARDVERLLGDAGIVRHRGKIESTINNARRALELRAEHGSLAAYVWRFEPAPQRGRSASRGGAARAWPTRRVDGAVEGPEAPRLDASSARRRCTRSCRRWASSTTTSRAASTRRRRGRPRRTQRESGRRRAVAAPMPTRPGDRMTTETNAADDPRSHAVVDVGDAAAVRRSGSEALGITDEALMKAVQVVGPRVDRIKDYSGAGGMAGDQVDA